MTAPQRSRIGWTDYSGGDANVVTGCTPVSAGCQHCYARAIYRRFGRDFDTVQWHPDKLERLANWKPRGSFKRPGDRAMVFVCDTGDLFHKAVPDLMIFDDLDIMAIERADIDWQVLTKRPERLNTAVRSWLLRVHRSEVPPNVWLGVTVENQAAADERIPLLLQVPAAVRWVSVEPCLEPVDLSEWFGLYQPADGAPWALTMGTRWAASPNWVVCGAESGPHRRPFDVAWARDLYVQCREAGVPMFYKQGSALKPGQNDELPGIGQVHEWPEVTE